MTSVLPSDLSGLLADFYRSRSVSWFQGELDKYVAPMLDFARVSFLGILVVGIIPVSVRVEMLTTSVFQNIELDPIEVQNVEQLVQNLERFS